MKSKRMELSLEELELVNGGWDLKSVWKKVREWITRDDGE